jgi:hypothetical protein
MQGERISLFGGVALALFALAGTAAAQGAYRADYAEVVRCESRDYRQIWCDADTSGGARIVTQLSDTACVEGRTWGWGRRGVWVSGGCRGEFETGGGRGVPGGGYVAGGYAAGGLARCESRDFTQIYCDIDVRGGVRLANQLSSAPCVEGQTWGVDRRGLWVRDGCRGEFEIGRGGGYGAGLPIDDRGYRGQLVVCESKDNRYRHCPAGIRRGADLVRQLSSSDCSFNRSWGYDRNGVWVDRGCRGEFAVD